MKLFLLVRHGQTGANLRGKAGGLIMENNAPLNGERMK